MSVKIAFYGEREKTGTTSNMYSLAWMMALRNPKQTVLIEEESRRYILQRGALDEERFLFTDCGVGMTKRARYRLRQADLVVVNLSANPEHMEPYFLYEAPVEKKNFFLVGNYLGGKDELKRYMKNICRVEEQDVGWIPYNNEFAYSLEKEKLPEFIRQYQKKQIAEHNRCFFEEMEYSFFLLQKKIETQSNELKIWR